jgi:uncharacterized protein (TIGR03083 family)
MDYAAALVEQTRLFGEVAFSADLTTPVPTCPGWSVLQVLRHLGRGDRWAAQIIAERRQTGLDPREVANGRPPDDEAGAQRWLLDSPRTVIDAADDTDSDATVWTFLGPRPPAWWVRRRLHEATVHRADITLAIGRPYDLSAELAGDGISEWLDRLSVQPPSAAALPEGSSLTLTATDLDATWHITGRDGGLSWSPAVPEAVDARLTGPATGLLLALVRRQSAAEAGCRVEGRDELWSGWLAATDF